jgi:hypothetical protein
MLVKLKAVNYLRITETLKTQNLWPIDDFLSILKETRNIFIILIFCWVELNYLVKNNIFSILKPKFV